MKRITLILCIMMLISTGCANRGGLVPEPEYSEYGVQSDKSSISLTCEEPGQEKAPPQRPETDYSELITKLSIHRLDDFAKPKDIDPDQLVTYYFQANYDGEGKLPIPEGYRQDDGFTLVFPHRDVEDFIDKYLGISSDYLSSASCYTDKGYEIPSMGLGSKAKIRVTASDGTNPAAVKITFEVDLTIPEGDSERTISPASRRELILNIKDGIKILSLKTTYTAQMN